MYAHQVLFATVFFLGLAFLLSSLDDFFIDAAHLLLGLSPSRLSFKQWMRLSTIKEKPMAVLIPAWNEADVLEKMLATNIQRIQYKNYKFYIGVYPNDRATAAAARRIKKRFPKKIEVVVVDRDGPTSKAHCLNCLLNYVTALQDKVHLPLWIAIHDAEDVIHPDSFRLINSRQNIDFVQLPIFSLPVSASKWVAGTYMDEFSEIHLKELPARQKLQMPVPSAGVGTFFSTSILKKLQRRFRYFFDEANLTEDYEISLRISAVGGKQEFLLVFDQQNNVIATQEYFPDSFNRSVRQKTRWITGITYQTTKKWGWFGFFQISSLKALMLRYALWRDRKSLWTNPSSLIGGLMILGLLLIKYFPIDGEGVVSRVMGIGVIKVLCWLNLGFLCVRLFQRARFAGQIYGWKQGLLSLPRTFLSVVINAISSLRTIKEATVRTVAKSDGQIPWEKTDHQFPDLQVIDRSRKVI